MGLMIGCCLDVVRLSLVIGEAFWERLDGVSGAYEPLGLRTCVVCGVQDP